MSELEEVSLELSNHCLCNCVHCSSVAGEPMPAELSTHQWDEIICQAKDLGASVISLSGGDPLIYRISGTEPYWKILVMRIASLRMKTLFYTSGVKKIGRLFSYAPSVKSGSVLLRGISADDLAFLHSEFSIDGAGGKLIYSLEGAKAATHNAITGISGAWFHLVNGAIPESMELGIDVELHFTPMALNFPEISDFLLLARKLGIERASFLRLVPQGRAKLNREKVTLTSKQFHQIQRLLYQWQGKPYVRIGCPLSFGHLYGYVDQRPRCHAGRDLLLIRPNGDVHACAGWKECRQLVLGNVKRETLREIWCNSPILEMIRRFNEEDAAAGYCKSCPWKSVCGGGCPAQRIIFNQARGITDPWKQMTQGVDPMCPRYNKIFTDSQINSNRTHMERTRIQDKKGNIE